MVTHSSGLIQSPDGSGEHVPAQSVAAAAVIDQVAIAAAAGGGPGGVFSKADGARARNYRKAGAVHGTPQGDIG